MIREVSPCGPVQGRARVPGSKSITNRALVCAALAQGTSVLRGASDSEDTALLANALNQLGVLVRGEGSSLLVEGTGGRLFAPKLPIPVGNAGTTLRFLLSLSALARGTVILEGSPRMAERPNDELLAALQELGAGVRRIGAGARYEVDGGTLRGGTAHIAAGKSSQFLSSLLLCAPYAARDTTLVVQGPLSSAPYVTMTLAVMASFGVRLAENTMEEYRVPSSVRYTPADFSVEADASSATYPLSAVAIAGGELLVQGASLASAQADAQFPRLLQQMGCSVRQVDEGILCSRTGPLRGIDAPMNSMPDAVPSLAAVALFAEGTTHIRNVGHLRYKESDRLQALATELAKLGADIRIEDDGLTIHPQPLHGAQLDTYEDHRLAMSFAIVGLRVPGIRIENPQCVRKSFPAFWTELEQLCRPGGRGAPHP